MRQERRLRPEYEWLRWSRTLLIDAYWPPLFPHLEYDPVKVVSLVKSLGANAIRFGAIGKWAIYPSSRMPPHPELGGRDLLAETIALTRKEGIRIIAYIPIAHGLPAEIVFRLRPEWAFHLDNSQRHEPRQYFGGEGVVPVCNNGAYHKDILSMVDEIINGNDIDAVYLDGPYHAWGRPGSVCQCDACRRDFETASGMKLPSNREAAAANQDLDIRRRYVAYVDWTNHNLVRLLKDINTKAKAKGGLPLIFNRSAGVLAGPRAEAEMIAEADGFLLETSVGGIEGLGIGAYYGKIVWSYTTPHSSWPRLSTRKLENDSALQGYRAVAHGSAPIVSYAGRYYYNNQLGDPLRNMLEFLGKHEKDFRGTQILPYCGIPFPKKTGRHSSDIHNLFACTDSLAGIHASLTDNHIQSVVLPEEVLDYPKRLSQFSIICLCSFGYLTDQQAYNVRDFVRKGGGLLATGPVSLFNENGMKRDNFLLADLLGADIITPDNIQQKLVESYRWGKKPYDAYLKIQVDIAEYPHERVRSFNGLLLPQTEYLTIKPREGSRIMGYTVLGSEQGDLFPAVIEATYGKGKVIYLTSAIEELYGARKDEELRDSLCFSNNDTNFEAITLHVLSQHYS